MLAEQWHRAQAITLSFSRRQNYAYAARVDTTRHSPTISQMRHLFVCTNTVASGKPACGKRGGSELLAAVQQRLLVRGVVDAKVTACACLGPCFDGPNAVVYPDAVWYGALDESDADAIVAHLADGTVHEAKRVDAPG